MARFRRTKSVFSSLPMRLPSFDHGIVVILSTMSREVVLRPFVSFGSTARRSKGASVGSLVKAQTVTDLVVSKRSSCTITTGRGLPA